MWHVQVDMDVPVRCAPFAGTNVRRLRHIDRNRPNLIAFGMGDDEVNVVAHWSFSSDPGSPPSDEYSVGYECEEFVENLSRVFRLFRRVTPVGHSSQAPVDLFLPRT